MPIKKPDGTLHFPNEDVSGAALVFYHVSADDNPNGGPNKFGIQTRVSKCMAEHTDMTRLDDEEYAKQFTSGNIMEVLAGLEKTAAMHPDCVEVKCVKGHTHDVSSFGLESLLGNILKDVAEEQYEEDKARGLVPHGMTFDEWVEAQGGPDFPTELNLENWEPPEGGSH